MSSPVFLLFLSFPLQYVYIFRLCHRQFCYHSVVLSSLQNFRSRDTPNLFFFCISIPTFFILLIIIFGGLFKLYFISFYFIFLSPSLLYFYRCSLLVRSHFNIISFIFIHPVSTLIFYVPVAHQGDWFGSLLYSFSFI